MKNKYSILTIACFVLSFLSLGLIFYPVLFLNIWLGFLSIIFGIVGLILIKKNNLKGKELAIAGIVISAFSIISYFVLLYLAISNLSFRAGGFA